METARLDDLLPPETRIDFVKVDVEGAEPQVFRGALRTLRRWAGCAPVRMDPANVRDDCSTVD